MPSLVDQVLEQGKTQPSTFNGADFYFKGVEANRQQQQIDIQNRSSLADTALKNQQYQQNDVLAPIRQQAMEAQNQLTGLKVLEAQKKWSDEVNNEAAVGQFSGLVSDLIKNNQDIQPLAAHQKIAEFMAAHPQIVDDPRAQQVMKNFNTSMQFQLQADKVSDQEAYNQGRLDNYDTRTGTLSEIAKARALQMQNVQNALDNRLISRQHFAQHKDEQTFLQNTVEKLTLPDVLNGRPGLSVAAAQDQAIALLNAAKSKWGSTLFDQSPDQPQGPPPPTTPATTVPKIRTFQPDGTFK